MTRNLRILIIVAMRLTGLFCFASGALSAVLVVLAPRGQGNALVNPELAVPWICGLLLWLLARPFADLSTQGLDD